MSIHPGIKRSLNIIIESIGCHGNDRYRPGSSGADDICIIEMLLLDLIGKGVKPSRYI
jgi:hypothetical protein